MDPMGNHWNVPAIGNDASESAPGRSRPPDDPSDRGARSVWWGLVPIVIVVVLLVLLLS